MAPPEATSTSKAPFPGNPNQAPSGARLYARSAAMLGQPQGRGLDGGSHVGGRAPAAATRLGSRQAAHLRAWTAWSRSSPRTDELTGLHWYVSPGAPQRTKAVRLQPSGVLLGSSMGAGDDHRGRGARPRVGHRRSVNRTPGESGGSRNPGRFIHAGESGPVNGWNPQLLTAVLSFGCTPVDAQVSGGRGAAAGHPVMTTAIGGGCISLCFGS
jgi:hypothetical protein